MRSNLMTLPQLHRSGRTSLVRLQIRDYRLVVLFVIEICTLFACYACVDYFSQFARAFTDMACFHEPVDIQLVLWIFWFQIIVIIIAALIRSNLTGKTLNQRSSISGFVRDRGMYYVCLLCMHRLFQPICLCFYRYGTLS